LSEFKIPLEIDVHEAAIERIRWTFDRFDKVLCSFSGGKDSTVMLDLVAKEAQRRGRKIGVLFVDLEAQYKYTIDHIEYMMGAYGDTIEPYWLALPISLRNAVSMYQPQWLAWDPEQRNLWVRKPPEMAISDPDRFDWFHVGMEFEELVPEFTDWYAQGEPCACFVGIRTDESLNRFRALMGKSANLEGKTWTTWKTDGVYNIYPVYDWRTRDIWIYHSRFNVPVNPVYERMHSAGLSIHQMRICQPYGDDQRKGLWLFHIIEPDTWPKIVARVHGANSGALYCREKGNVQGLHKVTLPEGHTWKSYASMLLESLPPHASEHYGNKIAVFLNWYAQRGFQTGIPDEADPKLEAQKRAPSWRRIVKMLLKNDWWGKTLCFGQTKSTNYDRYRQVMKERRAKWGY